MLNLVQIQERLKDVPMQALMQYANGSNPQIPPFLALGELNRRKKMQESAAAEQAAEMEGAPTIKQQIEQSTGLMALQGSRQRQAAQQQAGIQAVTPMAAPNTTTSEPAQMAGGGFVDDIVVPRDYQAGGLAAGMNPDMLKKLMMLKAMQQRKPQQAQPQRQGLAGLNMRPDMFARKNYAGGGIVAFQEGGPTAADVINAALDEEKKDEMPQNQRMFMELIDRLRTIKPTSELKREAGIGEAPDERAERLKAIEDEKRRFEESDTVARRVLALDPLRIGKSMGEYLGKRDVGRTDIERRLAEIQDLRTKAAYDAKAGNVEKSRAEQLDLIAKEQGLLKDMSRSAYEGAMTEQAFAGKTTDWKRRYDSYLPGVMQRLNKTDPNDPQVMEITARMVDESIGLTREKVGIAAEQADTAARKEFTQDYEKAAGIIDPMIQRGGSRYKEYRDILKNQGKEEADAFRERLIQEELRRMRGGARSQAAPTTGARPAPAAGAKPTGGPVKVTTPTGQVFTFPNQASADAFKARAGIK